MQFLSNKESVSIKPKPRKGYYKCLPCKKFVKCAVDINCNRNKMIVKSFNEVKVELAEIRMLLKLIEKEQNFILMLLIAVIVIFSFLMVI